MLMNTILLNSQLTIYALFNNQYTPFTKIYINDYCHLKIYYYKKQINKINYFL